MQTIKIAIPKNSETRQDIGCQEESIEILKRFGLNPIFEDRLVKTEIVVHRRKYIFFLGAAQDIPMCVYEGIVDIGFTEEAYLEECGRALKVHPEFQLKTFSKVGLVGHKSEQLSQKPRVAANLPRLTRRYLNRNKDVLGITSFKIVQDTGAPIAHVASGWTDLALLRCPAKYFKRLVGANKLDVIAMIMESRWMMITKKGIYPERLLPGL